MLGPLNRIGSYVNACRWLMTVNGTMRSITRVRPLGNSSLHLSLYFGADMIVDVDVKVSGKSEQHLGYLFLPAPQVNR